MATRSANMFRFGLLGRRTVAAFAGGAAVALSGARGGAVVVPSVFGPVGPWGPGLWGAVASLLFSGRRPRAPLFCPNLFSYI